MDVRSRLVQIAIAFLLAALCVAWRLCELQVVERDFWEQEAVKARTRAESIPFRRGAILDGRGRQIAATRTTFDLEFVFGPFRKNSTAGRLLAVDQLLSGGRRPLLDVLAAPGSALDPFAELTVGELKRLEPGARRADLLTYAAWLTGERSTKGLVERLRSAPSDALFCPRLREERDAILASVAAESAALAGLERAVELERGELALRIDDSIRATDARVVALLKRRDRSERLYQCERELHKELDDRSAALVRNVAHAAALDLASDPRRFPGLVVSEPSRRVYPAANGVCPQIVGRVGPPSESDLAALDAWREERDLLSLEPFPTIEQSQRLQEIDLLLRTEGIRPDEEIGREGLEALFEPLLRGRRGFRRVEAQRQGGEPRVIELVEPQAGRDLKITLDVALQRAAEAALARGVPESRDGPRRVYAGAFVLLELPEMKVRVVASNPAPSREEIAARYDLLAADATTRPLHPRAWRPYLPPPPGSSIKPIVAVLALSGGVIASSTEFECTKDRLFAPGDSKPIRCEGEHGSIDLHRALVKSCNHYFAHVAAAAGSARMVEWLRLVGLGRRTGFAGARLADGSEIGGLSLEVAGNAEREPGGRNLMLLGMGQGKVDATPLQMAAAIGALATRRYRPPTLIERIGGEEPSRPDPVELPISERAWSVVVAAMREVTEAGGTAGPDDLADLTGFDLATKTGTPEQWGRTSAADHSWFVGFFPSGAPRYAFAIFLERTGRHGGDAAAPLLLDLLNDPAFAEVAASARRASSSPPSAGPLPLPPPLPSESGR